jgi:hypothetical protein
MSLHPFARNPLQSRAHAAQPTRPALKTNASKPLRPLPTNPALAPARDLNHRVSASVGLKGSRTGLLPPVMDDAPKTSR